MLKEENLSVFADGKETDEKDIATVVSSAGDTVIFKDDAGAVFFLSAGPEAFEVGTVETKSALTPIADADPPLKERILAALGKEEK